MPIISVVGCNKRSALHRMHTEHTAQCLLVIAPYAGLHQQELLEDWELCQKQVQPKAIQPLK